MRCTKTARTLRTLHSKHSLVSHLGLGASFATPNVTFDTASENYPVGKRIFARVGGQVAMLGVCTAVSLTFDNEGTDELIRFQWLIGTRKNNCDTTLNVKKPLTRSNP